MPHTGLLVMTWGKSCNALIFQYLLYSDTLIAKLLKKLNLIFNWLSYLIGKYEPYAEYKPLSQAAVNVQWGLDSVPANVMMIVDGADTKAKHASDQAAK